MAPDMVGGQLLHVLGRELGQIHADAAGDEDLANAGLGARAAHELDERAVVGSQSLQMVRVTHERRLHFASTSGREQRIWYMLAVGPPMSLMTPENSGSAAILRTSLRTDSWSATA